MDNVLIYLEKSSFQHGWLDAVLRLGKIVKMLRWQMADQPEMLSSKVCFVKQKHVPVYFFLYTSFFLNKLMWFF